MARPCRLPLAGRSVAERGASGPAPHIKIIPWLVQLGALAEFVQAVAKQPVPAAKAKLDRVQGLRSSIPYTHASPLQQSTGLEYPRLSPPSATADCLPPKPKVLELGESKRW